MNVVMIVGDTVRADHLGCYGYFRDTSPNIDALAREGALFEDFYSGGCPTGPGFTSILTGLHSLHHGYYRFGEPNLRQVDDKIFTLPELMRAAGYTTAAFDNLMNLLWARAKHFVRGYDAVVNSGPEPFDSAHFLRAEQVNRRLLPWLGHSLEEPFFLFIHYWDPHMPYNQPDDFRALFHHEKGSLDDLPVESAPAGYDYVPGWGKVGAFADGDIKALYGPYPTMSMELYDGEIRYMDQAIGEVLNGLKTAGVYDRTAVLFTADHGEQLHQHAGYGWEHNGLHDADTHLPFVLRCPGRVPADTRVGGFCQQIDLLSTAMDLAGFAGPDVDRIVEADGTSVLPLLDGGSLRDRIFMEHMFGQRAIRTERWKLLDNRMVGNRPGGNVRPDGSEAEMELFDVAADPMEVVDLAGAEKRTAAQLRGEIDRWIASSLEVGAPDPAVYEDDERLKQEAEAYRGKITALTEALQRRMHTP